MKAHLSGMNTCRRWSVVHGGSQCAVPRTITGPRGVGRWPTPSMPVSLGHDCQRRQLDADFTSFPRRAITSGWRLTGTIEDGVLANLPSARLKLSAFPAMPTEGSKRKFHCSGVLHACAACHRGATPPLLPLPSQAPKPANRSHQHGSVLRSSFHARCVRPGTARRSSGDRTEQASGPGEAAGTTISASLEISTMVGTGVEEYELALYASIRSTLFGGKLTALARSGDPRSPAKPPGLGYGIGDPIARRSPRGPTVSECSCNRTSVWRNRRRSARANHPRRWLPCCLRRV